MGGRARQIIFDVSIIAGGIVSLALLALAFLIDCWRSMIPFVGAGESTGVFLLASATSQR